VCVIPRLQEILLLVAAISLPLAAPAGHPIARRTLLAAAAGVLPAGRAAAALRRSLLQEHLVAAVKLTHAASFYCVESPPVVPHTLFPLSLPTPPPVRLPLLQPLPTWRPPARFGKTRAAQKLSRSSPFMVETPPGGRAFPLCHDTVGLLAGLDVICDQRTQLSAVSPVVPRHRSPGSSSFLKWHCRAGLSRSTP
jgi:hypothetical protein